MAGFAPEGISLCSAAQRARGNDLGTRAQGRTSSVGSRRRQPRERGKDMKTALLLSLLALGAPGLVACGGSDDDPDHRGDRDRDHGRVGRGGHGGRSRSQPPAQ